MPDWRAPVAPPREALRGRYCTVEPLDPARHTADLHAANRQDREGRNWTYLPYGPFETEAAYRAWVEKAAAGSDPLFQAVIDAATGKAVGVASFMRIDLPHGVIEVGGINYSPLLQRKPAATEAMYLMMKRVFELGYRRYEWKCDSLNAPSRAAAQRLGFSYEGLFRQATDLQGPQPRHQVVLHPRRRMAGAARSLRALARARELRRERAPAREPVEPDGPAAQSA